MAKMSIHIPDETVEKINPFKDMMNISKVCSMALLKEVEILSRTPVEIKNTQNLILRLRKDLSKSKKDSFNLGIAMARLYTSTIDYGELQEWGLKRYSDNMNVYFPEDVENRLEKYLLEMPDNHSFDRSLFVKGWLTIMKKTWETVKNKV